VGVRGGGGARGGDGTHDTFTGGGGGSVKGGDGCSQGGQSNVGCG
jgi:hypothetical protein